MIAGISLAKTFAQAEDTLDSEDDDDSDQLNQ